MNLSVVIVNWNTAPLLLRCLESLYQTLRGDFEIFVVDNASADGSAAAVKAKFPGVRLIENAQNAGFARACNQGLRLSTGAYLWLLNPDTAVRPGAAGRLIDFLRAHPEAGAVGPKLLNPDGSDQRRGYYRKFPSLLQVLLFYTLLRKFSLRIGFLRRRFWEHTDMNATCEVDQIPGASLLMRREVLDSPGLLDERIFLFFEDVDFCYRLKKAGWRLYYYPQAEIVHQGGASFESADRAAVMGRFYESMLYFFGKHHGPWKTALLGAILAADRRITYMFLRAALLLDARNREARAAYAADLRQMLKAKGTGKESVS